MAGQKFQYDESGSTFFYFLLSFIGLALIPLTAYFVPADKEEEGECNSTLIGHVFICLVFIELFEFLFNKILLNEEGFISENCLKLRV